MHHSYYAIQLLAKQRSAELIARAERLNQLHGARSRHRRKHLHSLLTRFRPPASDRVVVDLSDSLSQDPAPRSAVGDDPSKQYLEVTKETR